ncbi:MAG: DUF4199 domain-containing protein [Bacteroidota bacterium]|nr:DUF4199 domain-containing protein [Bacteroidota bacterium]
MKTVIPSIEKNGIVIGLILAVSLMAYFFVMKAVGLAHITELRFFNYVILAIGIFYGIYKFKRDLHQDEFYLKGWAQGIYISVVAVVVFSLFMSIYIMKFDPLLLEHIRENTSIGESMTGFTLFISSFMEGMAGSLIITFASMQYLKREGSNVEKRYNKSSATQTRGTVKPENWRL